MDVPAHNIRYLLRRFAVAVFRTRLGQGSRTQPSDSLGSGPSGECRIAFTLLPGPTNSFFAVGMDDEVCRNCFEVHKNFQATCTILEIETCL